MNGKGLTQLVSTKKASSSRTENGAEVFVLSPDLLQKLGIHLGGVMTFPGPHTDISSETSELLQQGSQTVLTRERDETILETAKLMKKSIFLSPTFIPSNSHIPGELEIANIVDETNTLVFEELEIKRKTVINLEPENNDAILIDINENASNIIACEEIYNNKSEEIIVHVKTSNPNSMSLSNIDKLSFTRDITSYEHADTTQNSSLGYHIHDENVSNCNKESDIETSTKQNHDDVSMHVENKNVCKIKHSSIVLPEICSHNIKENDNTHISLTNSLLKMEHNSPIKINIISNEILDFSTLKSLNSPNRTDLTPVIIKTVMQDIKVNENNSIENIDGSCLKDELNEEIENLKGTGFTSLSKDSVKPISININNSNFKENVFYNIKSPMENNTILISSLEKKNNDIELQPSSDGVFVHDASNINIKKETFLNPDSWLGSNKVLNENLHFTYENIDKDVDLIKLKKKHFFKSRSNTFFEGSYINPKSIAIKNVEFTTTAIKIESENTSDNEVHNLNIQNTLENACTSCFPQFKNKDSKSNTEENIKSKIFLNNFDISTSKNNDINQDSTKCIYDVIDSDKVIKSINPLTIIKELTTDTNVRSINSKSCIQGVEKPGGDQNNIDSYYNIPKVLNTYKKRNKTEKPFKENCDCVESKCVLKLPELVEQNQTNITNADFIQSQEFCVCCDFGKLCYYENESLYEHIHFCQNNDSNKNSELIYSIYYDQDYVKYCSSALEEKQNNEVSLQQECSSSQKNFNNMCWNNYKMYAQEHITEFDFKIMNVYTTNHCDINKPLKVSENYPVNCGIIQEDILDQDDEINLNYKIKKSIENKKFSKNKETKYKKLSAKCNQNQKTKRKLNTHSGKNLMIPSNPANPESNMSISEFKNVKSTTSKDIKCGVCKVLLSEIEWDDHISNLHCYIAWKDGDFIELDDKELLHKLNQKLNSEGVIDCKICERKFKKVKLLISHLRICMKSFISNTDSSKMMKYTKCGVCQSKVEIMNWINHIAEEHNYLAWNDLECILDLQNENKVKEHLNKIIKQSKGLICSKCKVIYKYVNSFMKHIKKCDGTEEDHTRNTSTDNPSSLNTSFKTNVAKKGLRNKKKIEIEDLQTGSKKESCVNIENSSVVSNINKIDDQEELDKNKTNEISAALQVAKNNKKVHKTQVITDIEDKNDNHLVDTVNSSKTASLESRFGDTSPLKKIRKITDEIVFTDECIKNGLNSNPCTNNNNKVPIEVPIEMNIEKEQQSNSNEDNSKNTDIIVKKSIKNKSKNKGLPSKQLKRKSECMSEVSISAASNENVKLAKPTNKKSKVSESSVVPEETMTKCGVCLKHIRSTAWFDHIYKEHNYLAWEDGTSPIDINDQYEVDQHLRSVLKHYGELQCIKCGCKRKYVKPYMSHIKSCNILPNDDSDLNDSVTNINASETNNTLRTSLLNESLDEREISCGVCHQTMKSRDWIDHIQKSHNYLAWIEGEEVLDTNDAEEIQKHLMFISKKIGSLKCSKCGLVRKHIKTFLQHVTSCKQYNSDTDDSDAPLVKNRAAVVKCGVCFEEMEMKNWKTHAMKNHYNVAWIFGDTPIDVKNFYAVNKYLKEYQNKYNSLTCQVCGISRVSCYGFYAHILFCGKTEEESDKFKEVCEICSNKYICIYKHQHMAMHREQVYAKERSTKLDEQRKKERELSEASNTDTPGSRRAAQKAKNVLAKLDVGKGVCKKCGFEAGSEGDSAKHNCPKANDDSSSDSDVSVKPEHYSEEESNDSDIDSDVSNNEMENDKKNRKRKHGDVTSAVKVPRLPYSVINVRSYLQQSYMDFCRIHLTTDTLFPQWRRSDYEIVSDVDMKDYMPPLKESCKIKFIDDEWVTCNLFQTSTRRGNHIIFVGAPIHCISWAPPRLDDADDTGGNYLAIGCYSDFDCPRYNYDETFQHTNLIQIWDFGNTSTFVPKFEFGIAHDYGTVWAMDWCPSGVRDLPVVKTEGCELAESNRLGLLAIACSSGSAYIYSVPCPSIQKETPFYRMKPVAELRLSIIGNRKKSQATSISWSSQNGHAVIIVGYSDGIIAFYDLNTDSPFLTTTDNGVSIFYPYHDERSHNTCITGVGTYAGGTDIISSSVWSSASCTGASAFIGTPGRTVVVHTHLASTAATFTPHWPSVQLTGDSFINNLNQSGSELEWVGGGRRVGGSRLWCACARCGLAAATAPPLIRVLHAHPAYPDIKKQIIASLEMSPIGQKRKQNNDELAIKLEPINYDEAIKKYGLNFKLIPGKSKAEQHKASLMPSTAYPERYPLADVTCMAFCNSAKCHNKLALATHSGILLYINV